MKGINKVILVGNVGADPEVRRMNNGNAVSNISIATSDRWKDKTSGELVEKTEWHRVIFFGRLAEVVGEYIRKGSKIYIEGKLQTRKYTNQDGIERYTTEVIVDASGSMQMLDSRPQTPPTNTYQSPPPETRDYGNQSSVPVQGPVTTSPKNIQDGFDEDDIPF